MSNKQNNSKIIFVGQIKRSSLQRSVVPQNHETFENFFPTYLVVGYSCINTQTTLSLTDGHPEL